MRGEWLRTVVLLALASTGAHVAAQSPTVTPVAGPSHLHRLGLPLDQTSMGLTGRWGPPPDRFRAQAVTDLGPLQGRVALSGADLYRLDCRSCHQADGQGVPPEINTLLDPVQGASLVLWTRRMRQLGRPVDPAFAREVVAGAQADLRTRLVHGGEKMPPFEFLSSEEVEALLGYLDQLASVPGTSPARAVSATTLRVGEHLVKGTCHICHDATGSWPSPQALLDGAVPPLGRVAERLTLAQVIQKVRHGAPIEMGVARISSRGRMPVFNYLTDDEVAAAYLYLMSDPPQP